MSCIIGIHVVPGSKKNVVAGFHGESLKIKIQARAVDGKANEALVEFLAEVLGVKSREISIVQGLKSREKIISIEGAERSEILKKLA